MNRLWRASGAVLCLVTASAWAQPVCQQAEEAISSAEKAMSSEYLSGVLDNSAPRESMRQARVANAWAAVQASLTVMQMNKCPPYPRVVSEQSYYGAALKCNAALKANSSPTPGQTPECKRENWTRAGEQAKSPQ